MGRIRPLAKPAGTIGVGAKAGLVQCPAFIQLRTDMPNIGTVLREEIARLSRKESRNQVSATKKATAQHRRDIAGLKRQVAQLQRQVTYLARKFPSAAPTVSSDPSEKRMRFAAKGLRSQRNRLGLSQSDMGTLLGVSAQSIYNWESESARPRDAQLAKLAALRGIGKRTAAERLEKLAGAKGRKQRKTK
jgi:DNA-binding XRE family transcriptional regulator